ncbi:thiamine-phosphate kinase [Pasteurellaceae bacterium LIM206]|nr:thiamine-phosphate kinase [Pasteurellaceae bacterium LIM206]
MSQGEFSLIDNFFTKPQTNVRSEVLLAIGDDCAVIEPPVGYQLAITTDTMVENSHFYPDIDPKDLGYKAVATNLSDLAAMGATPTWISLALTLPKADEQWLAAFSEGMFELLNEHQITLIGGDTTSGTVPSVTITAHGTLKNTTALCRHKAQAGDWIYVSGTIGDGLAGFYLLRELYQNGKGHKNLNEHQAFLIRRNLHPTPRIALGKMLAEQRLARAALDLSDGLVGDLGHILDRSGVSAVLNLQDLPCSDALLALYGREQAELMALQGGEDYELCFTVPDEKKAALTDYLSGLDVPCRCIGRIVARNPARPIQYYRHGEPVDLTVSGFEHFK